MPRALPMVFVSATSGDLRSYRKAATDALLDIGCHPVVQEHFETDHRTIETILSETIQGCDAVVCLVGFAFGAHPTDRSDRSYAQIEYDIARSLRKPVYCFLATEECPLDDSVAEIERQRDLQRQHRAEVQAGDAVYYAFSDHAGLRDLVHRLRDTVNRLAEREAPEQLRRHYGQVQKARFDPLLIDILRSYYPYPLLERGGLTYPVFCLPSSDDQSRDVESILGSLYVGARDPASYAGRSEEYRDLLIRLGKKVYNGRLYVMDRTRLEGRLRVDCSLGWYYDALATCDALEWELLETVAGLERGDAVSDRLRERFALRNRASAANPEPCENGFGRCAALSISTLIVFNDGEVDRALIRLRSGLTAAHSDLYHVVPSFMMENAWSESPDDEYNILHQVLREYLEEVFGVREVGESVGQLSHRWFYAHPQAVRLREMLATGRAQLFLTGYAVNLLNLRPEICTLLLIRDREWFLSGDIRTNWEFLSPTEALERRGREFLTVAVRGDDDAIAAELRRLPGTFVPPGAAAFWMGVDRARRVLGRA